MRWHAKLSRPGLWVMLFGSRLPYMRGPGARGVDASGGEGRGGTVGVCMPRSYPPVALPHGAGDVGPVAGLVPQQHDVRTRHPGGGRAIQPGMRTPSVLCVPRGMVACGASNSAAAGRWRGHGGLGGVVTRAACVGPHNGRTGPQGGVRVSVCTARRWRLLIRGDVWKPRPGLLPCCLGCLLTRPLAPCRACPPATCPQLFVKDLRDKRVLHRDPLGGERAAELGGGVGAHGRRRT